MYQSQKQQVATGNFLCSKMANQNIKQDTDQIHKDMKIGHATNLETLLCV